MWRAAPVLLILLVVSCNRFRSGEDYLDDSFQAVIETRDGGILAAGVQTAETYVEQPNVADGNGAQERSRIVFLARVAASGAKVWERQVEISPRLYNLALAEEGDGTFAVAAFVTNSGFLVLRVDSGGADASCVRFGDDLGDRLSLCAASNGGFAFAGVSSSQPGILNLVIVDGAANVVARRSIHRSDSVSAWAWMRIAPSEPGFVIGWDRMVLKVGVSGDSLWSSTVILDSEEVRIISGASDGGAALVTAKWSQQSPHFLLRTVHGDGMPGVTHSISVNPENSLLTAMIPRADGGFAIETRAPGTSRRTPSIKAPECSPASAPPRRRGPTRRPSASTPPASSSTSRTTLTATSPSMPWTPPRERCRRPGRSRAVPSRPRSR